MNDKSWEFLIGLITWTVMIAVLGTVGLVIYFYDDIRAVVPHL